MANHIDYLNTGNSGIDTTFGNEAEPDVQAEEISEQQRQLAELLPSVQHIIDACDDEIDAVSDLRAYMKELGAKPSKVAIEAEYRARELYIGYLERLKASIAERVGNAQDQVSK